MVPPARKVLRRITDDDACRGLAGVCRVDAHAQYTIIYHRPRRIDGMQQKIVSFYSSRKIRFCSRFHRLFNYLTLFASQASGHLLPSNACLPPLLMLSISLLLPDAGNYRGGCRLPRVSRLLHYLECHRTAGHRTCHFDSGDNADAQNAREMVSSLHITHAFKDGEWAYQRIFALLSPNFTHSEFSTRPRPRTFDVIYKSRRHFTATRN